LRLISKQEPYAACISYFRQPLRQNAFAANEAQFWILSWTCVRRESHLLCGEVEFAGDEEEHGFHGLKSGVSAGLSIGGLEQSVDSLNEALVWRDLVQATMPSKWVRIMVATCFMGSTLERMTFVHH